MKHKNRADKFFNKEDQEKITRTIHDIESRTIGEVAVMVVDSSDRYHEIEVVGGILLGSFLALILTRLLFHLSIWSYISLSFLFFFPSKYLLQKVPVLKAKFIGLQRKEHTVRHRALCAFYEKGLYKTRKNTGVLFFLSLLERRVWVLADKGIYKKIAQETLNGFATIISQGIKDGGDQQAFESHGSLLVSLASGRGPTSSGFRAAGRKPCFPSPHGIFRPSRLRSRPSNP